jgi:hypothetical protein
VAPEIVAAQHAARPLDGKTLANLAKGFADAIPEGEFSVAALQGCACPFFVPPSSLSCCCLVRSLLAVMMMYLPRFFFLRAYPLCTHSFFATPIMTSIRLVTSFLPFASRYRL